MEGIDIEQRDGVSKKRRALDLATLLFVGWLEEKYSK
jgi:hypothetical protein